MNPNLKIFFKRMGYVIVFTAIIAALYFSITNFTGIDLSKIGEYIMYGFFGLIMGVMFVLIIGVMLRTVWTGIMNRADNIRLCCPDKKYGGLHIVASHYNPGGESSDGFDSYFQYYLDESGKLYLSKKVENDGNDIGASLRHLSEQTGLALEPDRDRGIQIGSNTYDNKPTEVTIRLKKGEVHFRGYEGLMDYGFKVKYIVGGHTKWRVTI